MGVQHFTATLQATAPTDRAIQYTTALFAALLPAVLFVFFTFIMQYVIGRFGDPGLNFLGSVVGFTDSDPSLLLSLSGKYATTETAMVSAMMTASGGNNLLQARCAALLGRNRSVLSALIWLLFLLVITFCLYVLLLSEKFKPHQSYRVRPKLQ